MKRAWRAFYEWRGWEWLAALPAGLALTMLAIRGMRRFNRRPGEDEDDE